MFHDWIVKDSWMFTIGKCYIVRLRIFPSVHNFYNTASGDSSGLKAWIWLWIDFWCLKELAFIDGWSRDVKASLIDPRRS